MVQTKGRFFEITVRVVFCLICFQLSFQVPYVIVIPGQRANLFSAILCAVILILARVYAGRKGLLANFGESLIALVLCFLVLLSALGSVQFQTSAIRGFVLLASALGGFFCARFLLNTKDGQTFFLRVSVAILTGVVLFSLFNDWFWGDISQKTPWNLNRHVVTNLIILLSFAPITLLLTGSGKQRIAGIVVLSLSFLVLYLSGERSAVLIPMGLVVLAFLLRGMKMRYALLVLAVMVICTIGLYRQLPSHHMRKDHVRVYYRIEMFPFSWHIAKKHPFTGKGLLAHREKYLEDYEIRYPHITKKEFAWAIDWARSPENLVLMLMSELGFPFLLIYGASVLYLLRRLLIRIKRRQETDIFPPLALFLSIVGALVHYMIFDGLLYPQLCWYFHLLLGLIPGRDGLEQMDGAVLPQVSNEGKGLNGFISLKRT